MKKLTNSGSAVKLRPISVQNKDITDSSLETSNRAPNSTKGVNQLPSTPHSKPISKIKTDKISFSSTKPSNLRSKLKRKKKGGNQNNRIRKQVLIMAIQDEDIMDD